VFVEADEMGSDGKVVLTSSDDRFKHISKILKLEEGDVLRVGVVNEGWTNDAIVVSKSRHNLTMSIPDPLSRKRPEARVSLLLAVPRPLRLERLLPVVACMGVQKLVLLQAAKVELDYFGSHLFRRPEAVRAAFVDGLSQGATDYVLPELSVRRNLKGFLQSQELNELFPPSEYLRIIAHPNAADLRLSRVMPASPLQSRVVVAVGPEGGWEDEEVQLFVDNGFTAVSLGERILRTDMAVPVLLGLAEEWAAAQSK